MESYEQYIQDNLDTFKRVQKYLDRKFPLSFSKKCKNHPRNIFTALAFCKDLKTYTIIKILFFTFRIFQCYAGRRRSIGDIYRLCKYYNPKITLIDVYTELSKASLQGKAHSAICTHVKRRVWYNGLYCDFDDYPYDEFGLKYPVGYEYEMHNKIYLKHIKT